MSFCEELWEESQEILQSIIELPFLKEMNEGTLDDEKFFYYIEQDILYLEDYAKASAYLVAKSTSKEQMNLFLDMVNSTFVEQELIHTYYTALENYQESYYRTPAYRRYRDFILYHSATKPLPIAYASMLACPWLYVYVGEHYQELASKKYRYWFEANCRTEVLSFLNRLKSQYDLFVKEYPQYHQEMKEVFFEALKCEYDFWNDAYLLKQ